jgi:hypothetical protein
LPAKLLTDWELWACANELIRRHYLDAPIHAGIRADELEQAGDWEGARNWKLIISRIEQLLQAPAGPVN